MAHEPVEYVIYIYISSNHQCDKAKTAANEGRGALADIDKLEVSPCCSDNTPVSRYFISGVEALNLLILDMCSLVR